MDQQCKRLVFKHPHLVYTTAVFIFASWGLGINSIPFFPILLLATVKLYTEFAVASRELRALWSILILAFATGFAFYDSTSSPFNPLESTIVLVSLGLAFSIVPVVTVITAVVLTRILAPSRRGYFATLLFPSLWATTWMIVGRNPFLGRWGTWTQESGGMFEATLQIASVAGLLGVDFVQALLAQLIADGIQCWLDIDPDENIDNEEAAPLLDHRNGHRNTHYRPTMFYIVVFLLAVFVWGNIRLNTVDPLESRTEQSLSIGCILKSPPSELPKDEDQPKNKNKPKDKDKDQDDPIKYMLHESSVYASQAKILIWSESAVSLGSQMELDRLLNAAKNITKQHVYLGITYTIPAKDNPQKRENVLTMIAPNGEIVFNYVKTHPVPLAESFAVQAGPGRLPVVNVAIPIAKSKSTHNITLSAAICLDMDFPQLISQASEANLLVSPAQTWSPAIGRVHFNMARVRAIEQGFAMLRCDSGGVSGFVDEVGRVKHWQEAEVGGAGSHSFVVDVKLQQTKLYTWYGSMGDWPFVGALLVLLCFVWAVDRGAGEKLRQYFESG